MAARCELGPGLVDRQLLLFKVVNAVPLRAPKPPRGDSRPDGAVQGHSPDGPPSISNAQPSRTLSYGVNVTALLHES